MLKKSQKTTIKQQYSIDSKTIVGQTTKHKNIKENNEIEWFPVEILKATSENGRTSRVEVIYDDEDEPCQFTLIVRI